MTVPLFAAADVPDLGAEPDRDTWCTNDEINGALRRFAGGDGRVDLDPCSNARSKVLAHRSWTREDAPTAAPIRPWRGTVYCNWPFSDPSPWVLACFEESRSNCPWIVGCGIADPSVGWFKHVWLADCIAWPDHRVQFEAPPGAKVSSNQHASVLPLWICPRLPEDERADLRLRFVRAFQPLGAVTPRAYPNGAML